MPEENFTNTLYTNDNLFILNGLNSDLVDLIYLDPPFNTKRLFSAPIGSKAAGSSFKDMWTWQDVNEAYLENLVDTFPAVEDYIKSVGLLHSKAMKAYLTYMVQRIIEMHRILKDTGSLCLHCDPTASHYLKLLLDEIFGKNNFRNEIVWYYRRWTAVSNRFQRMHDIIYWYSKDKNCATFTKPLQEYSDPSLIETTVRGVVDGKLQRLKNPDGTYIQRQKENEGVLMHDVWTDINFIPPTSKERTGYPTQKPLKLLKRIITALSNPGDIVLDPFCGCATACVAAQQLGRKWIGIDVEENAVQILVERLSDDAGLFKNFVATKLVP
ncbi:MAG: site-specific DNA-methyltransferase, partial [Ignavibacteria bacterium]|nr:site-specific DNA-methyltransferase [Ignavibacteria bacterium]